MQLRSRGLLTPVLGLVFLSFLQFSICLPLRVECFSFILQVCSLFVYFVLLSSFFVLFLPSPISDWLHMYLVIPLFLLFVGSQWSAAFIVFLRFHVIIDALCTVFLSIHTFSTAVCLHWVPLYCLCETSAFSPFSSFLKAWKSQKTSWVSSDIYFYSATL